MSSLLLQPELVLTPGFAIQTISIVQIEATQNEVDGLMHDLEGIAELRHQLTGAAYATTGLPGDPKKAPPASRKAEKKLVDKIAASVSHAIAGLLAVYDQAVTLPPQVQALERANPGSKELHYIQKALNRVNKTFANLLDYVEERAEEEKRDIADGKSDARLQKLIEEEHPTWYRSKTLKQLRDARADSKGQTFDKADVSRSCWTFSACSHLWTDRRCVAPTAEFVYVSLDG